MTGNSRRKSLAEYNEEHSFRGRGKWFDRLPEDVREEAIAGWKAGIGATAIMRWMREECGITDVTGSRLASGLQGIEK